MVYGENNAGNRLCVYFGGGRSILNKVNREGITEKESFEQRPEGGNGSKSYSIWRKSIPSEAALSQSEWLRDETRDLEGEWDMSCRTFVRTLCFLS